MGAVGEGEVSIVWDRRRLGDLADDTKSAMATGPFGSAVSSQNFRTEGVPLLRGSNLSEAVGVRLDESDLVFLDPDLADSFSRSTAVVGDLIFTCWGTVGQIGLIDKTAKFDRYVVSNKQMKMTPDPKVVDSRFLYYQLSAPDMISLVKSQAIGSSVPGFNLGQLKSLTISVPPLAIQRGIAEVLSALDDKIAVNRKLADKADEWIRVKYLVFTRLATEMVCVSDLVSHIRVGVNPGRLSAADKYVGLEHIPRRHVWLSESTSADKVASTKAAFAEGDILFGKLRPYFHKVVTAYVDGVCSTDILVLRPKKLRFSGWALAALSSDAVVEYATSISEGTRMPRAKWADIGSTILPWPGDREAEEFSQKISILRDSVKSATAESRTLANLRDSLLPQLMSGKLRVRDAESLVEKVI